MKDNRGRNTYVAVAALVWVYVILRATLVPFTDDESNSLYWYAERARFLPPAAQWDAGNHVLSSAFGVLGHELFGLTLWSVRLGALLLFPLYAWAVFRVGGRLEDMRIRWALWIALLTCPFLLDFFALFRGYGPAMAFWMVALDGGLRYRDTDRTRHLLQLLLGMALATAAHLSMLPLLAAAVVVIAAVMVIRWRRGGGIALGEWAIWLLLGVLPLLLGSWLAFELHARDLLRFGEDGGLVRVTLFSLSSMVLGSTKLPAILLVMVVLLGATLLVPLRQLWRTPLALFAALLWTDVIARVLMRLLWEVPYPEDRAALHLVPLAILMLAFAADVVTPLTGLVRRAGLILLLFLPLRALYIANLDHTLRWPEQSIPTRFLELLYQKNASADRPLNIGTHAGLGMALPYAARMHGFQLNPPDTYGFPEGPHDARIVSREQLAAARTGFDVVDSAAARGLYLLLPRPSLRTSIFDRYTVPSVESDAEFFPLWRGDTLAVRGDVLLQVRCLLRSEVDLLDLALVAVAERDGVTIHHRHIGLPLLRRTWRGEEMHLLIRMPGLPDADYRSVHLHNPRRTTVDIGRAEVKVHRIITVLPH